jgi:hypothetical protein
MTRVHQQTEGCSDFDVLLGDQGTPSFRVLLPEWIHGEGITYRGLLHIIPGCWQGHGQGARGHFAVAGQVGVDVQIDTEETGIRVALTVANTGECDIADVWANVCAALNHLPGEPGWCNRDFLPTVGLDRAAQGRYWYEVLTPTRLLALGTRGWVPMHPNPDKPDASAVALYSFSPSKTADARACAVESPAGGLWFFQSWDTPCRWCTPCPGNACMHLEPFLAERLQAGAAARIRGRIGFHQGDRASLEEVLCRSPMRGASGAGGG